MLVISCNALHSPIEVRTVALGPLSIDASARHQACCACGLSSHCLLAGPQPHAVAVPERRQIWQDVPSWRRQEPFSSHAVTRLPVSETFSRMWAGIHDQSPLCPAFLFRLASVLRRDHERCDAPLQLSVLSVCGVWCSTAHHSLMHGPHSFLIDLTVDMISFTFAHSARCGRLCTTAVQRCNKLP